MARALFKGRSGTDSVGGGDLQYRSATWQCLQVTLCPFLMVLNVVAVLVAVVVKILAVVMVVMAAVVMTRAAVVIAGGGT